MEYLLRVICEPLISYIRFYKYILISWSPVPSIDRTRPGPESGYQPTVNEVLDQLLSANFYDGFAADNFAEESFCSEIPFDYLSWTNE